MYELKVVKFSGVLQENIGYFEKLQDCLNKLIDHYLLENFEDTIHYIIINLDNYIYHNVKEINREEYNKCPNSWKYVFDDFSRDTVLVINDKEE